MKERVFQQHQDFVKAVNLKEFPAEAEIFVLAIENIPETVVQGVDFFRNEFYEILIATDHTHLEFAIDGMLYPPQAKPFVSFFSPNQLQSYRLLEGEVKTSGYVIYFSKLAYQKLRRNDVLIPFFKREYESYHQINEEEYNTLSSWCELMLLELSNASVYVDEVLHNLLSILAVKAKMILKETKSAYVSRPEQIIDHFLHLLDTDQEHNNVQFYADKMALTTKQLNGLVKEVLNKTALKVIQESTIEKAKALILQSNFTLTEISYRLGFDELSNFSRMFKRIATVSPNQFRVQQKK